MIISVTYALCALFAAAFAVLSLLDHRKLPRDAHLRVRNLVGITVWTLGALILFARAVEYKPTSYLCEEHAAWGIRTETSCPICALLQLGNKRGDGPPESDADFFTCSMHPQIQQQRPGDCPICGMTLIRMRADEVQHSNAAPDTNDALFTCSMHPQIKLPKAGKCPICFMDVVRIQNKE